MVERRADFADIAQANVDAFFGTRHPAWSVQVGDLVDELPKAVEPGTVDRVVLDMLAPWDCLDVAGEALAPGGVLLAYVATATQLSRMAEGAKAHGGYTEPHAWEVLERDWHLEGLAVRPVHRMHAHTGFLVTTRRLAPGVTPPLRKRRPAKGPENPEERPFGVADDHEWTPEDVKERLVSDKRARRIRREVLGISPAQDAAERAERGEEGFVHLPQAQRHDGAELPFVEEDDE